MKKFFPLLILIAMAMFTVQAQSVKSDQSEVSLISEVETIQPGTPFWVGLYFKLAPHWHIYWRNAGDAGFPPQIEWQLPEGFQAGDLEFPFPERIQYEDFINFGYEGEILFPIRITPPADWQGGNEVTLNADVNWLICKEVCIPEAAKLSLSLPVDAAGSRPNLERVSDFADARGRLPKESPEWQFAAARQDSLLVIRATPPQWYQENPGKILFFPYPDFLIHNQAEQLTRQKDGHFEVTVPLSRELDEDIERIEGILVSENGWRGENSERSLSINLPFGEALPETATAPFSFAELWRNLLFAFLGGMILNLMPCVLPVLSIKILSFVEHARESRRRSIQHGLMFTVGVLLSFLALAGALILLRAGGEQIGWGFQLQSPAFVVGLSVFIFLFGLNLFGVFEVGTSIMGVGQKTASQANFTGSFVSGVTATVVATPCTAPFMGAALGFALSQPPAAALAIFAFLGLGMAAPYLFLSAFPAMLKFIPKPGVWMETLKQFMGFLLMATVVWLASVLGLQTGVTGLLWLMGGLLVAGMGGWVFGRWGDFTKPTLTRRLGQIAAAVLILGSIWIGLQGTDATAAPVAESGQNTAGHGDWIPFSPEKVEEIVASGKPLFIDFTAAWCLSCQVNKKVVLHSEEIEKAFAEHGVTTMIADWTSNDERITRALAAFGRNSVPLYVLYPGKPGSSPQILPEVLTSNIVLEALKGVPASE